MADGFRAQEKSPEEMFLAWFLRLPHTSDVAREARIELARLDAFEPSESVRRLRIMLQQASEAPVTARSGRRRFQH